MREEHFDFRSEDQPLGTEILVERLDAQAIARQEKSLAARVPDGEGEHSAQVLHAVASVLFVEVDDGFGVAMGAVDVAAGLKLRSQFGVVVDFAVEDDPGGSVFVAKWLMAGGEVDDAEAAHAEADRAGGVNAVVIGTAVRHGVAHAPEDAGIDGGSGLGIAVELQDSSDAAHLLGSS